ncbi:MAG: hypothetical protein GX854_02260 [Clostridiales bacterium]|jgi:hypothetical protein|nr:hypothetical protein [Clostridiales bacterium]
MEKKKIPLPKFKSIDEMAHFFDNNSPLDVEGFEEVDIKFAKAPSDRGSKKVCGIKRKRSLPR